MRHNTRPAIKAKPAIKTILARTAAQKWEPVSGDMFYRPGRPVFRERRDC